MEGSISSRQRRPWRILVTGIIVFFVLLLVFALWSERQDAERLPPGELDGVEEPFGDVGAR